MTFEELLTRLGERVESEDLAILMDPKGLSELEHLRELARPATPGQHTREENLRIAIAHFAEGHFRMRRFGCLLDTTADRNPQAAAELYQAFLSFRALLESPSGLPPEMTTKSMPLLLEQLFGPEEDGETQGTVAYFLLANAPDGADRMYHATALGLLRKAVERTSLELPKRAEWVRLLDIADQRPRPPELDWQQIQFIETTRWIHSFAGDVAPANPAHWDEIFDRFLSRFKTASTAATLEAFDRLLADEVSALRALLRSSVSGSDDSVDLARVNHTLQAVGVVHCLRAVFSGAPDDGINDLARVVLCFAMTERQDGLPRPAAFFFGPQADPETHGHFAIVFLSRLQAAYDPVLLGASIVLLSEGAAALPPESPELPVFLANLAVAFGLRYQHECSREDLDQAIVCAERSLALTPQGDPNLAQRLSRIGTLHHARTRLTRSAADHEHAFQALEAALDAAAPDDPNLPLYLANLATSYSERIDLPQRQSSQDPQADLTDLAKANALLEWALAARTGDDRSADILFSLGKNHRLLHRITGDLAELEKARSIHERNLGLLAVDDPARPAVIADLSITLLEQHRYGAIAVATTKLHDLAGQLDTLERIPPAHRVQAYRHIGLLADALGDASTAVRLMAEAVRLLRLAVPPTGDWRDRQNTIGQHMGLLSQAIGVHCRAGDPEGAVVVAEQGRGAIIPFLSSAHSDLAALDQLYPELAEPLHRLRGALSRAHGVLLGDTSEQLIGHRRFTVADRLQWQDRYDTLIGKVRELPGFANFLRPPTPDQHRAAPPGGFVVLVNVDSVSGDAIIVADDGVVHVPLPLLNLEDMTTRAREFLKAVHFGRGMTAQLRRQRVPLNVLSWLWTSVVEPVLAVLPPQPRLWWMPSGAMALFPLHAAGLPGHPCALNLALSSYTTGLDALAATRARSAATVRRQLTVALVRTPGQPDLPNVTREAEVLHSRFPGAPHLRDRQATIDQVLSALPQATWAHFSCHASADFQSPLQGGLQLYDGTLTIQQIAPLHLPDAELAYLSACSTANAGVRFSEEMITLASAFQLVGFRHVVASLWPLQDASAAMVARSFYEGMPDGPSSDAAPAVLRQVALDLREAHPDRPDLWAPLIHLGP